MTSQPGLQTISIQVLSNISRSQGNQTIKFDQLIEHKNRNIFLQKLCRIEAGWQVPDLFIFLKKA